MDPPPTTISPDLMFVKLFVFFAYIFFSGENNELNIFRRGSTLLPPRPQAPPPLSQIFNVFPIDSAPWVFWRWISYRRTSVVLNWQCLHAHSFLVGVVDSSATESRPCITPIKYWFADLRNSVLRICRYQIILNYTKVADFFKNKIKILHGGQKLTKHSPCHRE